MLLDLWPLFTAFVETDVAGCIHDTETLLSLIDTDQVMVTWIHTDEGVLTAVDDRELCVSISEAETPLTTIVDSEERCP